jgi:hypothetical protein
MVRRSTEKIRQPAFEMMLTASLFGTQHLAKNGDANRRLRILLCNRIELQVGALDASGKAQQLGQESASLDVPWVGLDFLRQCVDSTLEIASLIQGRWSLGHLFSPEISYPEVVMGGAKSVTRRKLEITSVG